MKLKHKTDINADLVDAVTRDFEARKLARKPLELQWQLNIDFLNGRQNNYITQFETVTAAGKQYFWQEREVFNHIAPMIEARLAKLGTVQPEISVVPATSETKDVEAARTAKKVVESALRKVGIDTALEQANMWSELAGTAFLKTYWNAAGGRVLGSASSKPVYEGDVGVVVCSPFEIYPDNLTAGDVSELTSIIHAKAYKVAQIAAIWGEEVQGTDIDVFDLAGSGAKNAKSTMNDAAVVIERYELPSKTYPNGRLVIVAGGKLLFKGDLPYINQPDNRRGFPFVRLTCEPVAGSFFGRSVIERAIPVQRAYNSVKNRKTEFLNRLACGVMSVEEGSVDLESLESEGLCPGKVIVYRQGTRAPEFIDAGTMPAELEREEERLIQEFQSITGGADITRSAEATTMSGVALQILVEQDTQRIRRKHQSVLRGVAAIASQILRLYKQFTSIGRVDRRVNGTEVELFYWNPSEITSEEIIAENKGNQ